MKPPSPAKTAARLAELTREVRILREILTSRRRSDEEELRDRKLSALAEFAAGASHEINTPLATIAGEAQLLLKTEESLERSRALERIIGQAKRLHQLFTDLMLFARPPAPRWDLIRLSKVLEKVIQSFRELSLQREVRLQVPDSLPRFRVRADADMLEAAIAALLRNALEAAPKAGLVRLRIDQTESRVAIAIEDNGPGLTAAQKEHLFDPFYSSRTAGRGVGLGLSKAWRIAQLHGGNISWESEPDQPTRFILSLPLAAKTAKAKLTHALPSRNGHRMRAGSR